MPASWQVRMERATSTRGGSNIPTKPTKVMLASYSINFLESVNTILFLGTGWSTVAIPRQRRVWEPVPHSRVMALMCLRMASVMGILSPEERRRKLERSRTASGAPLTNITVLPEYSIIADMDLRSRENSRVNSFFPSVEYLSLQAETRLATSMFLRVSLNEASLDPIFSTKTLRAASVGSPTFS
eukprot:Lithocolla_globosa_v1_NODE_1950_length_2242_cov_281.407949.p2 type:complete len:185 gc:universal NODE_1950_length_2242_cov_281.407949:334-888(+)